MKRSLIGALLAAALMWTGGAQAFSGNPTFAVAGCNSCHNGTVAPGFTGGGGVGHTNHAQTRAIPCGTCHTAGFVPPPIANCGTCHPNKIGNPVLSDKHVAQGVTTCRVCHGTAVTTTTQPPATTTTTTTAATTSSTAATTSSTAATTSSTGATTSSTAATTTSTGTTTSTTAATGGQALFNSYCAGCHTGAAVGGGGRQVVGARTCSIYASINGTKEVFPNGVTEMKFLKGMLSAAQIQSISDYLNMGKVTGQQRYITACAGCHGADARGGRVGEGVRGENPAEIREAIRDNEGGMGFLKCLPASDISAIGVYLNGQDKTTTTKASTTTTRWGTTTTTRRYNPPATHTDLEDGHFHAPGKDRPYTNGCTTCHGATLTGGFAPSCYTCHGKEWSESGGTTTTTRASTTTTTRSTTTTTRRYNPPATHTVVKGGNRNHLHMPGYKDPFLSGCTACHGATLKGGFAPSCYTCHGKKWK